MVDKVYKGMPQNDICKMPLITPCRRVSHVTIVVGLILIYFEFGESTVVTRGTSDKAF